MIPGIDVSNNNGHIYWPSVAAQAVRLGIAKVSQGIGFRDAFFAYNYAQMRRVGITRGGYHYADPTCDPVAEARLYVSIVKANGGFEIRPILDLEDALGKDAAQLQAYARMWGYEATRLTGLRPMLYSYSFFIRENALHVLSNQFDLWLADYTTGPPDAGGWPVGPLMWQHSEKGTLRGIQGPVDLDWCMGDLQSILAPVPHPVVLLRLGSHGEAVEQLQHELNQTTHTHLAIDGIYGPITQAAVRAFQYLARIEVDGIAGPQTMAALAARLKGAA
ncbi:peptidoglycan-binding protein [Alicyclobacillus tolerans]|uniref:GH25 family lysozyme n=1 Tax=Alicyclobacillus tolerans TaxID=90970 RepID=UPI001F412187|nr:GH25 family lysozyme [Alicyclobacillus tolerans]MCF8566930.1 peptidoglycan-binding protein [Alicyclobacillus tolerans]